MDAQPGLRREGHRRLLGLAPSFPARTTVVVDGPGDEHKMPQRPKTLRSQITCEEGSPPRSHLGGWEQGGVCWCRAEQARNVLRTRIRTRICAGHRWTLAHGVNARVKPWGSDTHGPHTLATHMPQQRTWQHAVEHHSTPWKAPNLHAAWKKPDREECPPSGPLTQRSRTGEAKPGRQQPEGDGQTWERAPDCKGGSESIWGEGTRAATT